VGRVPIVVSSLKKSGIWDETNLTGCDWRVVVSSSNYPNIHPNYLDKCASEARPGAHFVLISRASLPGEGTVTAIAARTNDVLGTIKSTSYTAYCPVYGTAPFEKKVFSFGCPFDFFGFVTTDGFLNLGGYEYNKPGIAEEKLVKLTRVQSETAWYDKVVRANSVALSYFLNPLAPYSPITNVIVPPQTGLSLHFDDEEGEWTAMGTTLPGQGETWDLEEPLTDDERVSEGEDDDPTDGDKRSEGEDDSEDAEELEVMLTTDVQQLTTTTARNEHPVLDEAPVIPALSHNFERNPEQKKPAVVQEERAEKSKGRKKRSEKTDDGVINESPTLSYEGDVNDKEFF